MNSGKTVFAQIMEFISFNNFNKIIIKYRGNLRYKKFSCWDQLICLSFAQLTNRESLRDIETCFECQKTKLYHIGIRGNIKRTNIAHAIEHRSWMIYEELARMLILEALSLYSKDELIYKELNNSLYAFDSTTIDLCLTLFPWAKFRKHKAAVKIHTLYDIRRSIPVFIHITSGKIHDVNILDYLPIEVSSIYIVDKGYLHFERLYSININHAYFITRAKINLASRRVYSHKVDKSKNIIYEQTIKLTGTKSSQLYPAHLRKIKAYDVENDRYLTFLTNNFELSADVIADLYKHRWKIELFFKWIKQHLRINKFYGTSINAVKTQIWIAIGIYVTIAIMKKKLKLPHSLYTILQILSLTLFEKVPVNELFKESNDENYFKEQNKQLSLFNF